MPARHQGGDGEQGAGTTVEAGTGPHGAPGVLGDQLLEVAGEVGRGGRRTVDVRVPEHLASYRHAVVVPGHAATSWASSRMMRETCSGASAGAWWATSSSTTSRTCCTH